MNIKFYDGKDNRVIIETDKETAEKLVNHRLTPKSLVRINELSDGYHTYDELYEFRKMYNAVLFNHWATHKNLLVDLQNPIKSQQVNTPLYGVHKSWKHYDGEPCFGGGWFIVSAMLPTGLISNHYKAEDWDLFQVPEVEKALYEFDGHTSKDVLARLEYLNKDVPGVKGSIKTITLGNG